MCEPFVRRPPRRPRRAAAGAALVLLLAAAGAGGCARGGDPEALRRAASALRDGMTEPQVRALCRGARADLLASEPNRTLADGRRVRLVMYWFGPRAGSLDVAYDRSGAAIAAWITEPTVGGGAPRLLFDTGGV